MEKFHSRIRELKSSGKLPGRTEINSAISTFSKREWIIFTIFIVILLFSTVSILQNINEHFMVEVPSRGGSITEGIVGVPRFINPVLVNSTGDDNMVALIYSGLMRKNPTGDLIPDLALKYEISNNGLVYTFTLKDNLVFHNGSPLSSSDILFTINKIKDKENKSPYKINWDGVNIETPDEKTVIFTLKQPYASFLENTTLGILPEYLWNASPLELNSLNTNPIGSGPYMVNKTSRQSSGIIDSYELIPFKKFALGEPYIKKLRLEFYQNEEDIIKMLRDKNIEQVGPISPENTEILEKEGYQIESSILPRIFGLFFNQSQNQLFIDKTIIKIINEAIDKNKIIREVLLGYGITIDSPIPPTMLDYQKLSGIERVARVEVLEKVRENLAKAGWKKNQEGFLEKTIKEKNTSKTVKLEFSISTGNVAELTKVAELIKQDLSEIGIKIDIKTFELGNLNQNVIRPRKYDALLFGQIINRESDLYAFWHSSQRKDPGLNVALYTNAKVDKILEEAFTTLDEDARVKKYIQFEDEIKKDMPAIFLYSPDFIYVVSKDLNQYKMQNIIAPKDRYLNAYLWYKETEKVWKIFTNN